jgi:hypothetical protein
MIQETPEESFEYELDDPVGQEKQRAINDLNLLMDELRPKRKTINIKGTHFLEHDLHILDSLSPKSYHYLEQKRTLAHKKGMACRTIDIDAKPVNKCCNYHAFEDKRPPEKSPIVRHIRDTSISHKVQFATGGPSTYLKDQRVALRYSNWKSPKNSSIQARPETFSND